ncbi:hypothetical protein [Streptomyces sp. AS58]|nr:hypothetical protein [Streptomyces sp. AS58]
MSLPEGERSRGVQELRTALVNAGDFHAARRYSRGAVRPAEAA